MDDHNLWQERLSASLDGELSPEEERELQEHLAGCSSCRSAMALLRGMQAVLGGEEAEPPETLAKGTRYLYEQERKRGLNMKRWRFTAIAAVICLALLGAAALGPWGNRAEPTADVKTAVASEKQNAAYYNNVITAEVPAETEILAEDALRTEGWTDHGAYGGSMPAPAPQATMYSAERNGTGAKGAAESPAGEPSAANGEPGEPAADMSVMESSLNTSLYSADSLPGHAVYEELENAEGYYSVSFVYGEVPETIRSNGECTPLDAPEGQERWLVPLEVCQNEGYMEQFNEIYYGDLLSQQGLVIGLLDIEKEDWLP